MPEYKAGANPTEVFRVLTVDCRLAFLVACKRVRLAPNRVGPVVTRAPGVLQMPLLVYFNVRCALSRDVRDSLAAKDLFLEVTIEI